MSIRSAIQRSQDDNLRPSKKSYGKCRLGIALVPANKVIAKKRRTEAEERLVADELKFEKIENIILLENKRAAGLTLWQLRDLFDDLGFNCDVDLSEHHHADLNAVYNIGGYLIPFYKSIVNFTLGPKSKFRKLFLYKLAPGKARLHIRLFDNGDGSWLITSHIDEVNWMNIFKPKTAIKVHGKRGQGDYTLGTKVLFEMLKIFAKSIEEDKVVEIDANEIIKKLKSINK